MDTCCGGALEDFLGFLKSPNGSFRLKEVGPISQQICYRALLTKIEELETETNILYDRELSIISVNQSLFIRRLLLALGNLSKQIPLLLGSTELWVNKTAADISGTCGDLSDSLERETSP